MWLLFIPFLVLLIVGLALFSVLAGVVFVVGSAWPWILIGLGAWLFWQGDGRHRRRQRATWAAGSRSMGRSDGRRHGKAWGADQPKRESKPIGKPLATPDLPIDLQVKVEQIRRKVDVLLGFADRFPPFSQDLYLVRQTAADYLPRTINTFLGLSPDAVDRPLIPGGKTAREELKAQLDLLDAKLDEIAQDLQRQDADRVLANRRFLESRFGERDANPLTKGGAA